MPWPQTYLAIDTETTGLDSKARILEIAIVVMREREVLDKYHSFFNPPDVDWDDPNVQGALKVNGIKPEDLVGKPTFEQELDNILTHLRRSHLWAGHNVSFDIRMISQELRRCGIELSIDVGVPSKVDDVRKPVKTICTKQLFKSIKPPGGHRLSDAADFFKVKNAAAHTAYADAVTSAHVLCELVERHANILRLPSELRPV